ncbi:MAG: GHKL domain-containing protein [Lachnospiraceae bacterium]|nr:GHKL domain-containing protein [Lachnospiraceae bacterium]
MVIRNNTLKESINDASVLQSEKKTNRERGMGIDNVRAIVDKYDNASFCVKIENNDLLSSKFIGVPFSDFMKKSEKSIEPRLCFTYLFSFLQ